MILVLAKSIGESRENRTTIRDKNHETDAECFNSLSTFSQANLQCFLHLLTTVVCKASKMVPRLTPNSCRFSIFSESATFQLYQHIFQSYTVTFHKI